MKLTLSAPAKINLTLHITGQRADGYHLLSSVMQTLSLADTVEVEPIPQGIVLQCDRMGIPTDRRNLCWKAAKAYFEKSGVAGGVAIRLFKSIPDGAGLGGGSSDAAAVLKAMATLFPADVDLPSLAAGIGADVPFFLQGGTCLCQGVGEKVTPLPFPGKKGLHCVVAKPADSLSTPLIYRRYDESALSFSRPDPTLPRLLETEPSTALFPRMQNDLEKAAILLLPQIAAYKEQLLALGAGAAMMTGSGSAVFGLFPQEKEARHAHLALEKEGKEAYFCRLT